MITLKTGVIGSGKSLSAVAELAALLQRWATPAGEADRRPVYVHGIRGLSLEHRPLPVYPATGSPGDAVELDPMGRPSVPIAIDWASVADGALCIVDECQDAFPPRGNASKVPPWVAWCQRSRHHGVDVVLITQHPRLIDATLRAFVGKHQHYRRAFGGARAITYEWDTVSDSLSYKSAIKGFWSYPKKAFQWYVSAEEHRKQKFKLPQWLIVPVLGIAAGVYSLPQLFPMAFGLAQGKDVISASAKHSAPSASSAAGGGAGLVGLPAGQPGSAASSASAPVLAASAPERPRVAGCLVMRGRCECFDAAGYSYAISPAACLTASREYGTLIPYPVASLPAAPAASSPDAQLAAR